MVVTDHTEYDWVSTWRVGDIVRLGKDWHIITKVYSEKGVFSIKGYTWWRAFWIRLKRKLNLLR